MVRRGDRGRSMLDVIASGDAVVGKLGYSLPVEAACHGKPMLYVSRPDWPETPVVASWMDRNATARAIPLDMLRSGGFVDQLHTLLDGPRRPPVEATGGVEAADLLDALLRQAS